MKQNDIICIERTENGFIVRPEYMHNSLIQPSSWLVFNKMGYAMSPGDHASEPCLLKFIEEHFDSTMGKGEGR